MPCVNARLERDQAPTHNGLGAERPHGTHVECPRARDHKEGVTHDERGQPKQRAGSVPLNKKQRKKHVDGLMMSSLVQKD